MAAIDQNKTEEKALKYASFCDHDDQMIEAVVERLRGAGSTAAITSDKYSLSDVSWTILIDFFTNTSGKKSLDFQTFFLGSCSLLR